MKHSEQSQVLDTMLYKNVHIHYNNYKASLKKIFFNNRENMNPVVTVHNKTVITLSSKSSSCGSGLPVVQ